MHGRREAADVDAERLARRGPACRGRRRGRARAARGEPRGDVHAERRLAGAALLVDEGDPSHGAATRAQAASSSPGPCRRRASTFAASPSIMDSSSDSLRRSAATSSRDGRFTAWSACRTPLSKRLLRLQRGGDDRLQPGASPSRSRGAARRHAPSAPRRPRARASPRGSPACRRALMAGLVPLPLASLSSLVATPSLLDRRLVVVTARAGWEVHRLRRARAARGPRREARSSSAR